MQTDTVLLIDDNAVQAAVRQTILQRAGHHVITALSPERVLEQIKSDDLPFTVGMIITDHLMPGMNGASFVRELRELKPTIPVLVVSGLAEAEVEYEGLGVTFRTKPLLPEVLLAIVRALLRAEPLP